MNASAKLPSDDLESLVGRLADEYADRLGRGDRPDIEDYASRHPEAADELRRVLRSVEVLHELKPGGEDANDGAALPALGQLGDYRILREVGRGGMGIVYEAEQLSLQRRVALKVLPFASVLDPKRLQRFKNEALAAAQLDHPNIVSVHGTGCERGIHFYAMRYIEGQSLAELIDNLREQAGQGPADARSEPTVTRTSAAGMLPPPAEAPPHTPATDTQPAGALTTVASHQSGTFFRLVARAGAQIADGLEHAHQCGILHRDIKPANLLIDGQGTFWISDFGLAHFGSDGNLTLTGDLLGTLRYMSPEQALAQRVPVDQRTDVYSLGVTLYELLTLRSPFDSKDRQELLRQIAFEEPVPPRRLNRGMPVDLETIVLKAMAKNPGERYATARAFAEDLERFLGDRPIQARRPGLVQRAAKWSRRHRAVVTTALATLVVALVGTTGLVWGERDRTHLAYQGELAERKRAEDNGARAETEREDAVEQRRLADERRREAERLRTRAEAMQKLAQERELMAYKYLHTAQMALAQQAWERRHIGRMVELLEEQKPREGRPDLRDFAWYYLMDQARGDRRTISNKAGTITAAALAPDGRTLATGGPRVITLWDVAERRQRLQLAWPDATLVALAFSPDGRTLAAAGTAGWGTLGTGQIKLWDLANGKESAPFGPPGFEITSLAFAPDGKTLASGESSVLNSFPAPGQITLWDVPGGRKLRNCGGALDSVSGVAFAPDGKTLASTSGARIYPWGAGVGGKGMVHLWDPESGQEKIGRWLQGFAASCVAYASDGKTLAVGGVGGVKLLDPDTTIEQATLPLERDTVWSVSFTPDGKTLAGATSDETVKLWDIPTRKNFASRSHRAVETVAFAPDGLTLASAGGQAIELWTVTRHDDHAAWKRHDDWVTGLVFLPDGKRLVSASYDGTVIVWDARTGGVTTTLGKGNLVEKALQAFNLGAGQRIRTTALSPDGKHLATGGDQLHLWDLDAGRLQATLKGHTTWIMAAAYSPDGATLASADADGVLKLWDGRTGAELATLSVYPAQRPLGPVAGASFWSGSANYATGLAFSPDGKILLAAGLKGIRRWDAMTHQSLPDAGTATDGQLLCAFSRDGSLVVTGFGNVPGIGRSTGGGGNGILLWDAAMAAPQKKLTAHGFSAMSLAVTPDGRIVAVGGADGRIRLWSVATGQELMTLPAHGDSVLALAFDPTGETLAAAGSDGAVRLWRAPRAPLAPK